MVVRCEQCDKAFLLPDDRIKPEGTRVRCKQCRHEFVVRAGDQKPEPPPILPATDDLLSGFSDQVPAMPESAPEPSTPELNDATITSGFGSTGQVVDAPKPENAGSAYEVTFSNLGPAEEPPGSPPSVDSAQGGGDDFSIQGPDADPLIAPPDPSAPGGDPKDVSIDFGVLEGMPGEASPPVAAVGEDLIDPFAGPESPPLGIGETPAPVQPAAPDFQLEDLALDDPLPEDHGTGNPSGAGVGMPSSESARPPSGSDPLASLDLDFTLDEKAMGGEGLTGGTPPVVAPPVEPAPSQPPPESELIERGVEGQASGFTQSRESLKAEFDELAGGGSVVSRPSDEVQPFTSPPPPPSAPIRRGAVSPSPAATPGMRLSESLGERVGGKEKQAVVFRSVELRSPSWIGVPAWLLFIGCALFGAWRLVEPASIRQGQRPVPGLARPSDRSIVAALAGLRPATLHAGEGLRSVRGRSFRNTYGQSVFVVTGLASRSTARRHSLRAVFLDQQGWKMGQAEASWVRGIPSREFAILRIEELQTAIGHLAEDVALSVRDVPFVILFPTPDKSPKRYLLEWVPLPAVQAPAEPSAPAQQAEPRK